MMDEKLYTDAEAMAYLNIKSRNTFYRLLRRGDLAYINLNPGGKQETRRYRKSQLDAYLNNLQKP